MNDRRATWRRLAAATAIVALFVAGCSGSDHDSKLKTPRPPVGPYLSSDPTPHSPRDEHWHAAIAVNVCGVWQPGPTWPTHTSSGSVARIGSDEYAGLHTHTLVSGESDGLIHMEPARSDEAGWNATVGRYLAFGGWRFSTKAMTLWTGASGAPIASRAGDRCGPGPYAGQKIELRWARGSAKGGATPKMVEQRGDLNAYKLYDADVIAIYALPKSVALSGTLQRVPSVVNLVDSSAQDGTGHSASTTTAASGPPACPSVAAPAHGPAGKFSGPTDQHLDPSRKYQARITTTCGVIVVALDVADAPKGANNFVFLARAHFFDGLTFHRAVTDFVIQGGDPNGDGSGGPGYSLPTEAPKTAYTIGDVAYAKTAQDPAGTAGSQFFIVTGEQGATLPLDYGRFGHVVAGIDVAKKIESLSPGDGPPRVAVYIQTVTITP